jgi:hypothetical protein
MTLTSERLVFTANRMVARMGGRDWAAPRRALVGFAVADRALKEALGGGLRRRLRVNLNDGSEELFVVKDADDTAERLTDLLNREAEP